MLTMDAERYRKVGMRNETPDPAPPPRRRASSDYKFQADSIPEVDRGIEDEKVRLVHAGKKHGGRAIREAHVLNAWACYMLSLPPGERTRAYEEGMAIYEGRLASERPVYWDLDGPEGGEDVILPEDVVDAPAPTPSVPEPARRKRIS